MNNPEEKIAMSAAGTRRSGSRTPIESVHLEVELHTVATRPGADAHASRSSRMATTRARN